MARCCAIVGCKKSTRKRCTGIKYYCFPSVRKSSLCAARNALTQRRRIEWIRVSGRKVLSENNFAAKFVCSAHFISGAPADVNDINDPDWIPSIGVHYNESGSSSSGRKSNARNIWKRAIRRVMLNQKLQRICQTAAESARFQNLIEETYAIRRKFAFDTICPHTNKIHDRTEDVPTEPVPSTEVTPNEIRNRSEDIRTEPDPNILVETAIEEIPIENIVCIEPSQNPPYEMIFEELQRRTSEMLKLKEMLDVTLMTKKSFVGNDEKVQYFTGLPNFTTLRNILNKIDKDLNPIAAKTVFKTSLENFQKLLLTMMKLRLGSTFVDLGYRFFIPPKTASKIFDSVIEIMDRKFASLIFWPNRESFKKRVPKCFDSKFGSKVAVIIDCFEIPVERTVKNKIINQTVKYLIGIAPHGIVSFVSSGYGDQANDEIIIQECGIIDRLLPGNIVLADRGSTVKEVLAVVQARGTTNQIHTVNARNSKGISVLRAHVERVIGNLKLKFPIFNGPITINTTNYRAKETDLVDRIIRVTCAMINLCDSNVLTCVNFNEE